jgi:hypothetical protein
MSFWSKKAKTEAYIADKKKNKVKRIRKAQRNARKARRIGEGK